MNLKNISISLFLITVVYFLFEYVQIIDYYAVSENMYPLMQIKTYCTVRNSITHITDENVND